DIVPRTGSRRDRAVRPREGNGRVLCRLHVQPAPAAVRARRNGGTAPERHPRDHPQRADLLRFAADPDRTARLRGHFKETYIQTFTSRGIDTVLTMCAGCGSTLKNDYTTPFKVIDINELLTQYGIEPPAKLGIRATYHDPCHLLRGQGVRDQPRELIRNIVDLVEMPAICCGSGGGVRAGVPEEAAALGRRRGEEIRKTGAELVITSCPFCEFHIAGHTDKAVKHVVSVLLDGYREKDRLAEKKNE